MTSWRRRSNVVMMLCVSMTSWRRRSDVFTSLCVTRTHDVYTTSIQRRCNVMTLHRRWGDVVLTSCARWVSWVEFGLWSITVLVLYLPISKYSDRQTDRLTRANNANTDQRRLIRVYTVNNSSSTLYCSLYFYFPSDHWLSPISRKIVFRLNWCWGGVGWLLQLKSHSETETSNFVFFLFFFL